MTDDARDRIITELADSEHWLARELAATRQLLHVELGLSHEQARRQDRLAVENRRLREENRRLREIVLHDTWRIA